MLRVLVFLIALTSIALAQQPPITAEQRLAVSVANLTLQNAQCATQFETLTAENAKLKAQLDALKSPEKKK